MQFDSRTQSESVYLTAGLLRASQSAIYNKMKAYSALLKLLDRRILFFVAYS